VGNPKTLRKESDVAVTTARPLHVSKVSQSKKGKTKQATLTSNFHAHGSMSSLWSIRLVRTEHRVAHARLVRTEHNWVAHGSEILRNNNMSSKKNRIEQSDYLSLRLITLFILDHTS